MQAGAQAAHGFGGQVRRVVDRQQVGGVALVALEVGQALFQQRLLVAERNGGVDGNAGAFDVFGVLHAALERFTDVDEGHRQQPAEQGGDDDHQRLVGLDRSVDVRRGVIDDTHIAHGAGADDVQLLGLVQQHGVGFRRDFHVTGQAQQFLLGRGQGADLLLEGGFLCLQLADLIHQRLEVGVLAGEAPLHLGALEVLL